MYHLGFTYRDAYSCPVWQRFWFIGRFKKDLEESKQQNQAHQQSKRQTNGSKVFRKSF
jgi:hypothetical protein